MCDCINLENKEAKRKQEALKKHVGEMKSSLGVAAMPVPSQDRHPALSFSPTMVGDDMRMRQFMALEEQERKEKREKEGKRGIRARSLSDGPKDKVCILIIVLSVSLLSVLRSIGKESSQQGPST